MIKGPNARDQIALCAFHSFLMNAGLLKQENDWHYFELGHFHNARPTPQTHNLTGNFKNYGRSSLIKRDRVKFGVLTVIK